MFSIIFKTVHECTQKFQLFSDESELLIDIQQKLRAESPKIVFKKVDIASQENIKSFTPSGILKEIILKPCMHNARNQDFRRRKKLTNCINQLAVNCSNSDGNVPFAHVAIGHSHLQQPVPRGFPLFKRCEWLVVNCNVGKRAPLNAISQFVLCLRFQNDF